MEAGGGEMSRWLRGAEKKRERERTKAEMLKTKPARIEPHQLCIYFSVLAFDDREKKKIHRSADVPRSRHSYQGADYFEEMNPTSRCHSLRFEEK